MRFLSKRRVFLISALIAIAGLLTFNSIRPVRAQNAAVSIQNFAFNPMSLTVPVGSTVTWTNNEMSGGYYGAPSHTATSDTGAFDAGVIAPGESRSITFNNAGTFAYHCMIHTYMHGSIVVQASAPTNTATSPPATSTLVAPTATSPAATATSSSAAATSTATSPAPTATSPPVASPTSAEAQLTLKVKGTLRAGHQTKLRVSVGEIAAATASNHLRTHVIDFKAVSGATVQLDARKVGVKRIIKTKSDKKGNAALKVKPSRAGTAILKVSRSGFLSKSTKLKVKK